MSIDTLEKRASSLEAELKQARRERWAERQRAGAVKMSDPATKPDPKARREKAAKHLAADLAERKLALIEDALRGIEQTLKQACRAGRYGRSGCCMFGTDSKVACGEQQFELE